MPGYRVEIRQGFKARAEISPLSTKLCSAKRVGFRLKKPRPWQVLALPAIAEVEESHAIESPFGRRQSKRSPGDLLHPSREDMQSLSATRQAIGEFSFSSQYQQNPIPLGGNIVKFEWLKYYE